MSWLRRAQAGILSPRFYRLLFQERLLIPLYGGCVPLVKGWMERKQAIGAFRA